MDLGIRGKRGLVCAASKGLGRGCAEALAEAGVDLVINSRTESELTRTAEEIAAKYGTSVTPVAADITTDAGRAKVLEAIGQADILVTNAGGPPPGDWRDWSRDDFIKAIDANMLSAIALMQAVMLRLLTSTPPAKVRFTIVDGRVIYEDGRVTTVDEKALRAEARALMNGYRETLARDGREADRLAPYYREMYLKAAGRDVGLQRRLC